MKARTGITLVELLIALAVLSIVITITYSATVTSLNVQSSQEATTSSQAKLRRVMEVFTQELRGAVLGSISHSPLESNSQQVSFIMLEGGAGYQVLPHDSGSNNSFKMASNTRFLSSDNPVIPEESEVMLINSNGSATVLRVHNVRRNGDSNSNVWRVNHPGCGATIDYTPSTLLFSIQSIAFRYDEETRTLYQVEGGQEFPLAFDLTGFALEYVYVAEDGSVHVVDVPYTENGAPVRVYDDGSQELTLKRIQVTMRTEGRALGGRAIEREYAGLIELSTPNRSFDVQEVVPCS